MTAVALLQTATERAIAAAAECAPNLSPDASDEAAQLAAAIAKDVPGAAAEWKQAFPRSPFAFARAADGGGEFLSRATPTLARVAKLDQGVAVAYAHALADVASAACSLGEPNLDVISRAALAAATQLRAAGIAQPAHAADVHLDAAFDAPKAAEPASRGHRRGSRPYPYPKLHRRSRSRSCWPSSTRSRGSSG